MLKVHKIKKKIYKKHNSFENLLIKNNTFSKDLFVKKIVKKFELQKKKLSKNNILILKNIIKDLTLENKNKDDIFKLSSHVIAEIKNLDENDYFTYLIHRYRYEIYPKKKILDDYPPYLQIEPSSICNYRCVFCYQTDNFFNKRSTGHMGKMSLTLFKKIIDQAEKNIHFISLASRGEPLINNDIGKMLEYSAGKFLNLKINTNVSQLNEDMSHAILSNDVGTLVFSIDEANKTKYEKIRVFGNFDRVKKNIEKFAKIKEKYYPNSRIITRVSGVKFSDNQDINSMQKTWSSLVDQVAFVSYLPWENVYEDEINLIRKPCSDLWRRMFIWWDGKVNPCDTDYKSFLKVGNLSTIDLKKAWNSEIYNNLRQQHIEKNRKKITPCDRCVVT